MAINEDDFLPENYAPSYWNDTNGFWLQLVFLED